MDIREALRNLSSADADAKEEAIAFLDNVIVQCEERLNEIEFELTEKAEE